MKTITQKFKKIISIGVIGLLVHGIAFGQEPVVTTQNLPYIVNFGTSHFSSYPAGLAVSRGINNSFKTTTGDVTTFPAADFTETRSISTTTLTAPLSNSVGGTNISGGSSPHSYLEGDDAKLLITLSTRLWATFFSVRTSNLENINVKYSLQLTERPTNNATSGLDLTAFLQYRVSTTTGWMTVNGSEWNTSTLSVGGITNFNLTLPGSVSDLSRVDFRITNIQANGVTASDLLSYAIDNISVTGTPLATPSTVTAVALRVKSVTPSSTSVLTEGKAFDVAVETIDANGNVFAVESTTGISISVIGGTGNLTGTTTGVIAASATGITLKGLVYSKAEVITLAAVATSGMPLSSVTSVITITSDPLGGLTILYSQDFETFSRPSTPDPYPVSLTGVKQYNLDGGIPNASGSPQYGTVVGFVLVRTSRGPWSGNGGDAVATPTFFATGNSTSGDSTFVASATTWFTDVNLVTNRWLVLPPVTLTGNNVKMTWQSMSRGSFGFRDSYSVYASFESPGVSINTDDFELVPGGEFPNVASRRVTNNSIEFPASLSGAVLSLAFKVNTPAGGGDRIFIDNIVISSSPTANSVIAPNIASAYIYPNPAEGSLYVANVEAGSVQISDITGVPVLAASVVGKSAVDISSLAPGVYVVKVQSAGGVSTAKFIKK